MHICNRALQVTAAAITNEHTCMDDGAQGKQCVSSQRSSGELRNLVSPRTRVHAGLLDVLHDAADDDVAVLVAQRVHVQLVRAVQVLVDQHRAVRVDLHRVLDVALQVLVAARARPPRLSTAQRLSAYSTALVSYGTALVSVTSLGIG